MDDLARWGFSRDILVNVSSDGSPEVVYVSDNARVRRPVVYASLRDDGLALKIGMTERSLWERWSGTIRVIGAEKDRIKLRENEWSDRDQWRKYVLGRSFTVWSKQPETRMICYAEGLPSYEAALVEPEERYLDALLEPVVGRALSLRGKL